MITAYGDAETKRKALENGAEALFTKVFGKTLGVFGHAELFEPVRNLRHRGPSRIDFSVLPDLTDQDLEKLGVVLGDRRLRSEIDMRVEGAA